MATFREKIEGHLAPSLLRVLGMRRFATLAASQGLHADVFAGLADDDDKLRLVVIPLFGPVQADSRVWSRNRRRCFQEQTKGFDRPVESSELLVMNIVMDRRVLRIDLDVKTIIRRRRHDLARIGQRAAQLDLRQIELPRTGLELLNGTANLREVRDQCIAHREWPAMARQRFNRARNIIDHGALDQTEPIVVEAA